MVVSVPGYNIIRFIGSGTMGIVYLAEQPSLRRKVALKYLYPHHAESAKRRERFFNEARLMASLIHPNIVQLFDMKEIDGNIIIVMEYIDGRSLDTVIESETGPMPYERALPLMMDMIQGIGYAHSSNIIHRDIKPGNIMVTTGHIAKVSDFGVAKLLGQKGQTKAGSQVGTLIYMSPEQVLSTEVDQRSDIYSLGVTLYEMLAGRLPFDDEEMTEHRIMDMILKKRMPDPRDFYHDIPEWLVSVIYKAIEKKPEKRYSSCDAFIEGIERGLATGSVNTTFFKSFGSWISNAFKSSDSSKQADFPELLNKRKRGSGGFSRNRRHSSSSGIHGMTAVSVETETGKPKSSKPEYSTIVADTPNYLESEETIKIESLRKALIVSEFDKEFREKYPDARTSVNNIELSTGNEVNSSKENIEINSLRDPIDFENEPVKAKRFPTTRRSIIALTTIIILTLFSVHLNTIINGEGKLEPLVPVDTPILYPHFSLSLVDSIYIAGNINGTIIGAAISPTGDIAFLTDGAISVYRSYAPADSRWIHLELDSKPFSVSFTVDGNLAYTIDNSDDTSVLSEMVFLSLELQEINRYPFEFTAPMQVGWISDSVFGGVIQLYREGDVAGYEVFQYNLATNQKRTYLEVAEDIAPYTLYNIPDALYYRASFEIYPIVTFHADGSAYISPRTGTDYSISCFDSTGARLSPVTLTNTIAYKSELQIASDIALYEERMGGPPVDGWVPNQYLSSVKWMFAGGEHLWVQRGNLEGINFDVISFHGELLESIKVDLPENINWQFRLSGNRVLAYCTDEEIVSFYLLRSDCDYQSIIDETAVNIPRGD